MTGMTRFNLQIPVQLLERIRAAAKGCKSDIAKLKNL